ncbi:related to SNU23 - component of snRNP involved in mRNA splicing [Melanopsichium pennsylvanicum]|uniref:Related to SNU23 - component of snRNP involved in mRNA splicing n=2 Tax=Melanopsichium pennsylvanicum TaxID=63383 RepID=A0AAJ5C5H7_9BASI|nr:u1-like zn-finger protein [Melanopsichium pennsylvanicum 4]SNX84750.1 related to SNU23 - component of snRNP involved in mRNA splicing [Melanopsichium pennsylvanicum]
MSVKSNAAAGAGNGVGPSRRTWDKEQFSRKAMSREKRQAELDSVNAQRRAQALPPLKRLKSNAPEPELAMQARRAPLDLEKNQGKTLMVDLAGADGKGQTGPGFYCEVCRKLLKDNLAYLDHVNGRVHLMRIGQSTQQDRATLQEVNAVLDELRGKKFGAQGVSGGGYDFEERLRKIAQHEENERQQKREKRRLQKLAKKADTRKTDVYAGGEANGASVGGEQDAEAAMVVAMGFGGFGSTKNR